LLCLPALYARVSPAFAERGRNPGLANVKRPQHSMLFADNGGSADGNAQGLSGVSARVRGQLRAHAESALRERGGGKVRPVASGLM